MRHGYGAAVPLVPKYSDSLLSFGSNGLHVEQLIEFPPNRSICPNGFSQSAQCDSNGERGGGGGAKPLPFTLS